MKIEPAPFSMLWSHPKDSPGPCQWKLLDHNRPNIGASMAEDHPAIEGTCRTYKEARGLLMRIGKACQRAYRYGYLAGYKAGRTYRKTPRVLSANAAAQGREAYPAPACCAENGGQHV